MGSSQGTFKPSSTSDAEQLDSMGGLEPPDPLLFAFQKGFNVPSPQSEDAPTHLGS